MSCILFGSVNELIAYPIDKVSRVDYSQTGEGDTITVTIRLYTVGRGDTTVYRKQGGASVVEDAQALYRKILNGLSGDKPINLSEFALVAPKKAPAKKAPAKKTEPETPAEQPSE